MSDGDELTLTIHGLDAFNGDVDGEVFAQKLWKFIRALNEADKAANGKRRYKFLITDLQKNTATASVREQLGSGGSAPADSSFDYFEKGVQAIYADAPAARRLPHVFVRLIVDETKHVGDTFRLGEIKRKSTGTVILIDDFLRQRAERVLSDINRATSGALPYYQGVAYGSFDGTLLLLDSLESAERAVLVLTAGGKKIECIISRVDVEQVRRAYKRRCIVQGAAHYSADQALPVRIDASQIDIVEGNGNLARWQGQFNIPPDEEIWN